VAAAVADPRPPEVLAGLQGLVVVALLVARTGGLGGCLVGGGSGRGLLLLAQTPGHGHLGVLEPREVLSHEGVRRRRRFCRGLDLRHVPKETTVVEAAVLDETTEFNAEDCAWRPGEAIVACHCDGAGRVWYFVSTPGVSHIMLQAQGRSPKCSVAFGGSIATS
jgi:hypothetical protein